MTKVTKSDSICIFCRTIMEGEEPRPKIFYPNASEVRQCLATLKMPNKDVTVKMLIQQLDPDESGTLNWEGCLRNYLCCIYHITSSHLYIRTPVSLITYVHVLSLRCLKCLPNKLRGARWWMTIFCWQRFRPHVQDWLSWSERGTVKALDRRFDSA